MSSTSVSCILWPASHSPRTTAFSDMDIQNTTVEVPAAEFANDSAWTVSPLSAKLGLALKIKAIPTGNNSTTENCRAPLLFLDEKTFTLARPILGDVIIARCDGKSLHFFQTWFILEQLDVIKNEAKGHATRAQETNITHNIYHAKDAEAFAGMLTSRYFAATFEIAKKLHLGSSVDADISLENPFINKTPKCDGCGAARGAGDVSLLRCARCVATWYCGKACQKVMWPMHKGECAKAKQVEEAVVKVAAMFKEK